MVDSRIIQSAFTGLQSGFIARLTQLDPTAQQQGDTWKRSGGGGGLSHLFTKGALIEKGGINYSHVHGNRLPPAATTLRPGLANRSFEAMGVSVVLHPRNPYVPTTHMNVRFFTTTDEHPDPGAWWFGGGFDLTPCYGFTEDAIAWHQAARDVCRRFGDDLYPEFKKACDDYFYLPHRKEARGIGGLFFDDFNELGFEDSFSFARAVGESFLPAWEQIALKRQNLPFTEREKAFQRYRRGRYVEFNLLYDRGTLFGLQSKGRTESILMSLPPQADWVDDFHPEPGSPEEALQRDFLVAKDWLNFNTDAKINP